MMLRPIFTLLLAACACAVSALAQTAALTPGATTLNPSGGNIVFTSNTTFSGNAYFALTVTIPPGWRYVAGVGEPGIKPAPGAEVSLSWLDISSLPSPVGFGFTVSYPAGITAAVVTSAVTLHQTFQVTVRDKVTGVETTETRDVRTDLSPAAIVFGTQPSITGQPQSASVGVGGAVNFVVTATGSAPLSYQWFKNSVQIAGATAFTLALTSVQTTDAGSYIVTVTNAAGSATSTAATLTVNPASGGGGGGGGVVPPPGGGGGGGGGGTTGTAPVITAPPANVSVTSGSSATFSVVATGTAPLVYQWSRNGVLLGGSGSASLTLANVQAADAGIYAVLVSNATGFVTSTAAVLTVTAPVTPPPTEPPPSPSTPPSITIQPASQTVTEGGSATFSVNATGTAPLAYQWRNNGAAIGGASSATLAISRTSLADAGTYTVVVTNRAGSATSAGAALVVSLAAATPIIMTPPAAMTALVGANVAFRVVATGTAPLTYQWSKNGATVAGATSATLALTNVSADVAGSYSVVVTNSLGSAASPSVAFALAASAVVPAIETQPVSQSVPLGGSVGFGVSASGTAPFTYQWRKNGAILPGATTETLALDDVRPATAGSYSVAVTNSAGTASSQAATLTVIPPLGVPSILSGPADTVVLAGAHATFTVSASGALPLAYEWRKDGTAIPGATGASFTLANVQASDVANYGVAVTNAFGTVVSRAAALAVRGRSYAGCYFGSFGNGGTFAITIRDDNTGVFLGYATAASVGFISRDVTVDDNGRFRITVLAPTANTAHTAAAATEFVLDATISPNGSLAGTVSGLDTTVSAARSADNGSTQAVAGFYQAGADKSSATTYTIVSPAGQAYVLTVTATATDGGRGTVSATGQISVVTASNATVTGTISMTTATLAASVTTTAGARLDFTGGSDTRTTVEKLQNISTRGAVGGSNGVMIAGFVIAGDSPKPVMIRAIGPALAGFGVGDALSAARLELFAGPSSVATNKAWSDASNSAAVVAAMTQVGAFTLNAGSKDAVLLLTLEPGAYTAVVSGDGNAAGVALVEVYDVSVNATPAQKVINIASRGTAGSGDNTLIAGFVIGGTVPKRVLIRGVGPALTGFGVSGALVDPQLRLFQDATVIATNDDWSADVSGSAPIASAAGAVGAFALNPGSKDAALLINLAPGPYTVQVTGPGTTSGVALVEVYEVP